MSYIESPIVPYFKGDEFRSAVDLLNQINDAIRAANGHNKETGVIVFNAGYIPAKIIVAFVKTEFESTGFWHINFSIEKKTFTLTPKLRPEIMDELRRG